MFRDGVLLFDRLVSDYAAVESYRRMYLLKIDGAARFYSAGSILGFLLDKEKAPIALKLSLLKTMALHLRKPRPAPLPRPRH